MRVVAGLLVAATVAALGLTVVFVRGGQPQLEGALLMVALGSLGAAVIWWATRLMPDDEAEEPRPTLASSDEPRREFYDTLQEGAEGFTGRRGLLKLLGLAAGSLGLAAVFPLRSLGPTPGRSLFETPWRRGSRVVTSDGRPVPASEMTVGSVLTVFPEGHERSDDAATMLIRVEPERIEPDPGRADWSPDGHVAYSKLCTHVGCPVGLYRETTHELLCPCHQSTFDVLRGAAVTFGPATRPLPQLPLEIDDEGFLVAREGYTEPVGPIFWNRDRDGGR
ncbi:MAG: Rieske (2Fe-2S) protein [Actinomycetota bacterium]|nr:Rieske (2Fe-2S) protein [Actinomycetota bacterium]